MAERALAAKTTDTKKENPASRIRLAEHSPSADSPAERILFLQRTIGNQAVQRLMKSGALQAKLRIGATGDIYEQEADRVAEQVMRMPEPQVSKETEVSSHTQNNPIQRRCPRCIKETQPKKEEEKKILQTKEASGSTSEATTELVSSIRAIRGGGQPLSETHEGKRMVAHELTHVMQQRDLASGDVCVQRSPAPKVPTYKDCTEANTMERHANRELEKARDRARDFVDVAISRLNKNPVRESEGSSYRIAQERHFLNPTKDQRIVLRNNYRALLSKLKPENIRCTSTDADKDYCNTQYETGFMGAFMRGEETFLCWAFWLLNRTCKAITLIHEAAHAIGIGSTGTHPPYRGSTEYPSGAGRPDPHQSASLRMNNPDAYAFFAAHVWRDTDTECGVPNETIEITEPPSDAGTMLLIEQAEACAEQVDLSPFCFSVMEEAFKKGWKSEEK